VDISYDVRGMDKEKDEIYDHRARWTVCDQVKPLHQVFGG
jgi:hypothetical protein